MIYTYFTCLLDPFMGDLREDTWHQNKQGLDSVIEVYK